MEKTEAGDDSSYDQSACLEIHKGLLVVKLLKCHAQCIGTCAEVCVCLYVCIIYFVSFIKIKCFLCFHEAVYGNHCNFQ